MPMDFADLNYYNELNKVDFDKIFEQIEKVK